VSTVLLGSNRFVDCGSILSFKGTPVLAVKLEPLRAELTTPEQPPLVHVHVNHEHSSPNDHVKTVATPRSFAIFWDDHALTLATLLDDLTIHLKLDLRPLGINIYDDPQGLHIGQNVFTGNVVKDCATAINLD